MNKNHSSAERKGNARSLYSRLFPVMILITVIQLITFLSVFLFSGEFSYIRKYAYNSFTEKSSNRKSHIEGLLVNKTDMVYESAEAVNDVVEKLAAGQGLSIDDIQRDKELNRLIMRDSAEILVSLIRQNQVNDVFVVLDSGSLYDSGAAKKLNAMYIRDIDPSQNVISNNEDLLMETGSSDIASELDIVLDFEWSAMLDVSDNKDGKFDFFFNTVSNARKNPTNKLFELSCWYGFSGISRSAQPSMKFAAPLIASDGTVYGVIGIGLTEKYILDALPNRDSFERDSCYIIGTDPDNSGEYDVEMHMGSMFSRLVGRDTRLSAENKLAQDIYDFSPESEVKTLGTIDELNLYNSASIYKNQKWALISVGEHSRVMAIYYELLTTFIVSAAVSIIIAVIGSAILNRKMTAPVTNMIDRLNESSEENNGIIEFAYTNISEIDALGDSIVRLQKNVRENSSRVSRLISMMDMGIGVFMCDCKAGSVFMGESLIKLLDISELPQNEDAVVSFDKFSEYIQTIDEENLVCADEIFSPSESYVSPTDKTDIEIQYEDTYLRFSLSREKTDVIGLVQDITAVVMEKKRIEFDRDYDITTGLLNRRAYLTKLDELFSKPEELKVAAIIMIDLDNLKYVNDTYGHDFGDDYIRAAANVFKDFYDYGGIVSRMSGDEFNILLYGFDSKDEVRSIITLIRDKLANSSCLLADGSQYKIRASGGVSWYPDDSRDYETLIKYADFSMYTIKHSTKGNIAEFDMEAYLRDSILMTGVEEMNRIIENELVKFAMQPVVSAKTGDIYGYELLMRPQSEILKTPLDFIRIAETGSKLYEVEHLTWLKGLSDFNEKIISGQVAENAHIFINSLSNCIISSDDIAFIESEYPSLLKNIVLEMLEAERENELYTNEKQSFLGKWGGMLALDDFGSGYNSELLFIKLNPDLIKIDRSIISGCNKNKDKVDIIKSIITMAKSKNTFVLAEGVETSEELRTVIECGADLIQGYYVSRPMFDPLPVNESITDEIRQYSKNVQ